MQYVENEDLNQNENKKKLYERLHACNEPALNCISENEIDTKLHWTLLKLSLERSTHESNTNYVEMWVDVQQEVSGLPAENQLTRIEFFTSITSCGSVDIHRIHSFIELELNTS